MLDRNVVLLVALSRREAERREEPPEVTRRRGVPKCTGELVISSERDALAFVLAVGTTLKISQETYKVSSLGEDT